ncbi:hypothetical protein [Legionella sp. CNM-4043-24]|uniref:hypothetical protein n=1 Tax=Legionella sp. CNM-4043-24 TaxID=3421646 RepID=UPI00403B18C4
MSILVLDLDFTVIVAESELGRLNSSTHELISKALGAELICRGKPKADYVRIINPKKLSTLIEHACENHDGIMILTAGLWGEDSIKYILKNNLDITESTTDKLDACHFITPGNTVEHYKGLSSEDIALLPKNERLQNYIDRHPELQGMHFVMLDDSLYHIESFKDCSHVTAVHATTTTFDIENFYSPDLVHDAFYEQAQIALDNSRQVSLTAESVTPNDENAPPPALPSPERPPSAKRSSPTFFRTAPESPEKKQRTASHPCEERRSAEESSPAFN